MLEHHKSEPETRKEYMPMAHTIVFVCEHGAAKSVIAATYFNQLASENNLDIRATARGTYPEAEISPKALVGLKKDGLLPTELVPQKLSLNDVESAHGIVSFCELPEEYSEKVTIDRWDGVPPVSENYETARDAILVRLKQLINNMSPL